MDTTEQALHPDSPNGEEIAKKEKDKIFNAISQVEEKIARLKLSISGVRKIEELMSTDSQFVEDAELLRRLLEA